jgi:DNA-binding transcriptional regulator YdaS (Cro superfamily)
MTLDEYLYDNNLSLKEFCSIIGFHPSYVTQVKNGRRVVPKRLAYVVYKHTNGKVKLYESAGKVLGKSYFFEESTKM